MINDKMQKKATKMQMLFEGGILEQSVFSESVLYL